MRQNEPRDLRMKHGEEEMIRVASDRADAAGSTPVVVVTGQRVVICRGGADVLELPLREIQSVRFETLVGGGCLEVRPKLGSPIRIHCSASLIPRFSGLARGIEQLRSGESLRILRDPPRARCGRSGRLLSD